MELCTRFLVHNKFSGDSPRELDEFCYYFIVLEFNLHPKKKKKNSLKTSTIESHGSLPHLEQLQYIYIYLCTCF